MHVLLIGDSILMGYSNGPGYGGFVRARFEAQGVKVTTQQCADSGALLNALPALLASDKWDLIHFNCGLHDLKRDRTSGVVVNTPAIYAKNLKGICELVCKSSPRVIFATITPVHDAWHQTYKPFDRRQEDVRSYNETALDCVSKCDLSVNDLHATILEQGQERLQFTDGVHFTEAGSRVLADKVFECVSAALAHRPED
jgi:isoamyl acetate esterase